MTTRPKQKHRDRSLGAAPLPPLRAATVTTVTITRAMTPAEHRMVRALGCCRGIRGSRHYSAIKLLHASSHSAKPAISDEMARIVRACVTAFASELPASIVELAGGAR